MEEGHFQFKFVVCYLDIAPENFTSGKRDEPKEDIFVSITFEFICCF